MTIRANVIAILFAVLLDGCLGGDSHDDCQRIVDAMDERYAASSIGGHLALDCGKVNYVNGDVEACLHAIRDSGCEQIDEVYRAKCNILAHVGL